MALFCKYLPIPPSASQLLWYFSFIIMIVSMPILIFILYGHAGKTCKAYYFLSNVKN